MSIAVENFVKAIYLGAKREHSSTRMGSIAKRLSISNAAATDMAKKLAKRNLLVYEPYQQLQLTDRGEQLALGVLRKHRLWETFLYELFDMSLHEIHREAELLEHQTSDFMADKLYTYLEYPKFDPHGDPIPDAEGHVEENSKGFILAKADLKKIYCIARLQGETKEFFDFCTDHGLKKGNAVKIIKKYEVLGMIEIECRDKTIVVTKDFSNQIYVEET